MHKQAASICQKTLIPNRNQDMINLIDKTQSKEAKCKANT